MSLFPCHELVVGGSALPSPSRFPAVRHFDLRGWCGAGLRPDVQHYRKVIIGRVRNNGILETATLLYWMRF